jgi:hypothetical protein
MPLPTASAMPPTTSAMVDAERPDGTGPDAGPAEFFEDMAGTFIAMARAEGSRVRLVVSRKAGSFIAKAVMAFTAVLLTLVIALFLFLAWGLWLGQVLGNAALGMLAAGGSFLVLLLLFYLLWRWVLRDRIILSVVNAVNDHG